MAFEPVPYSLDVDDLGADSLGLALRSGRLIATVVSKKTGKHITVQLKAKRRQGKRFRLCELPEAERVYLDVPAPDGGGKEIGCLHLRGRWADKVLPPWEETFDHARLWAATRVLDATLGRAPVSDEQAELLEGKLCLVCGRELTDPESIARNIGPECWRKVTGLGASAGEHQSPGEQLSGFTEALAADHGEPPEGNAEDGANGLVEGVDYATLTVDPDRPIDSALEQIAPALAAEGEKVRRGGGDETREQIEAELQQATMPSEDDGADLSAAGPRPHVGGDLLLLRAGDDPRRLLESSGDSPRVV